MLPTFLDTLFVVALANRRDRYHAQALEFADLYDGQPLVTTDAVLIEISNALARNFHARAVEIIGDFLQSPDTDVVRLTPNLFERAFALFQSRPDKGWGLTDCLSFVVMQERGLTDALTFDRHFRQAGFRPLLREQENT